MFLYINNIKKPGWTKRADDLLDRLKDYLDKEKKLDEIEAEDVKKKIGAQLEQTFKEEINPLIDSLTQSEINYISEQIGRIKERGNFDKKLEEIKKMIDEQKAKETELKDTKEKLYWNKDAILKDLTENHIEVKEDVEYMWYKWKIIRITLPGVWKEYEPFEYFVSDESVCKDTFESNPELEEKSYSMKDVWGLLWAMNRYMQSMWVETDWDMDYENDLKYWKIDNYWCEAWDCLKECLKNKAKLDRWYWLKDKNVDWRTNSRALWGCNFDYCVFSRSDGGYDDANLFLRLS